MLKQGIYYIFSVKRRKSLSLGQKFEILQLRALPEYANLSARKFAQALNQDFHRDLHFTVICRILRDREKILNAITACDFDPNLRSRLKKRDLEKLQSSYNLYYTQPLTIEDSIDPQSGTV